MQIETKISKLVTSQELKTEIHWELTIFIMRWISSIKVEKEVQYEKENDKREKVWRE